MSLACLMELSRDKAGKSVVKGKVEAGVEGGSGGVGEAGEELAWDSRVQCEYSQTAFTKAPSAIRGFTYVLTLSSQRR